MLQPQVHILGIISPFALVVSKLEAIIANFFCLDSGYAMRKPFKLQATIDCDTYIAKQDYSTQYRVIPLYKRQALAHDPKNENFEHYIY